MGEGKGDAKVWLLLLGLAVVGLAIIYFVKVKREESKAEAKAEAKYEAKAERERDPTKVMYWE